MICNLSGRPDETDLECFDCWSDSGRRRMSNWWVGGAAVAGGFLSFLLGAGLEAQAPGRIRVSDEPLVEIGGAEGQDAYLFSAITNAVLLDDGRVAVADGELTELRLYGPDGRFLHSVGGRGEGPGEFSEISAIWLLSDQRIGVWDAENLRITTFLPDGELVSAERVQAERQAGMSGSPGVFLGSFGDDDVILASVRGGRGRQGVVADQWILGRFGLDGTPRGLVGQLRGFRRLVGSPLPFTPIPRVTVLRDSVFAVDGYEPHVGRLDPDRGLLPTIGVPTVDLSPDQAWSFLGTELRRRDEGLYLELMDRLPPPDEIPQIGGLLADGAGQLWVKVYDPSVDALWLGGPLRPGAGGTWRIVGPDGAVTGTIRMPDGVIPLHITEDRLVGMARDALDVERLVVHLVDRGTD